MNNEEKLKTVILALYEYIKIRSIKDVLYFNPFIEDALGSIYDHEIVDIMSKIGHELNLMSIVTEPNLVVDDLYGEGNIYDVSTTQFGGEYGLKIEDKFFDFIKEYGIADNNDFYYKIHTNLSKITKIDPPTSIKNISWNKENLTLLINNISISFKKASRESDILNALLTTTGIKRKTAISYDEILEKSGIDQSRTKEFTKALYHASRRINAKISSRTDVSCFLNFNTREVSINSACF